MRQRVLPSNLQRAILLSLFAAVAELQGSLYAQDIRFNSAPSAQVSRNNDQPELVATLGHTLDASSAAFSPDGQLVVTGGIEDHVAILWEADTGREIRRFVGHGSSVNAVAFSPDGRFVVTGSGEESGDFVKDDPSWKDDFTARLWDISTGKEIRRFEGHTKRINVVAFSLDGLSVLTGSDDHTIRAWDVNTGRELKKTILSERPVSALAFSPDGKSLMVGTGGCDYEDSGRCDAYLIDARYRIIHTFPGHRRTIGSISFSPDGRFVATSTTEPLTDLDLLAENADLKLIVYQWDVAGGKELRRYRGFGPVAFSHDSRWILTAGAGESDKSYSGVKIWDANSGQALHFLKGFADSEGAGSLAVSLMTFTSNGDRLLLGYDYVHSAGNAIGDKDYPPTRIVIVSAERGHELGGLAKRISHLAYSTNGQTLIAEGRLWRTNRMDTELLLPDGASGVIEQALSADGNLAFIEDDSGTRMETSIWENGYARKASVSLGYARWLTPDNKYFLTESMINDGFDVASYSVSTGVQIWSHHVDHLFTHVEWSSLSQTWSFASLSPDGSILYLLPVRKDNEEVTDGELLAFSVATGQVLKRYRTRMVDPFYRFISVSPDGRSIIYPVSNDPTSGDSSLLSLDLLSGRVTTVLTQAVPFYAAYSHEGKFIVMQDLSPPAELKILSNTGTILHRASFVGRPAIKFSPDGKLFLTLGTSFGLKDGANLWDLQSGAVVRQFAHSGISAGDFIEDGHLVVTGGSDGVTRIWNAGTGSEICRLISLRNGDWVATSPDGRFDTNNLDNPQGLSWVVPDAPLTPLPLEIFMRDYYEPQLLPRLIKCNKEKNCDMEFKPVRDISKLNRVQPPVKIADVSVPDSDGHVNVTVEVGKGEGKYLVDGTESTRTTGIYDVRLFRDGQMVGSWPSNGAEKLLQQTSRDLKSNESLLGEQQISKELRDWRGATEVKPDGKVKIDQKTGMVTLPPFRVKLPRGKDASQIEFSAYAFNEDRVKSQTAKWEWPSDLIAKLPKAEPIKPRAYVISVGVNAYENSDFDLEFAADDARRMSEVVSEQLKAAGQYEQVVPVSLVSDYETKNCQKVLTAKQATKDNFRVVLELLAGNNSNRKLLDGVNNADQLQKATPDDLVLIMYSSHGYADRSGNFYFIPYDTGPGTGKVFTETVRQHSISSEELSLWLRDVDAGEMVMIVDACHSAAAIAGQDFKPGPMGSRGLGQLSYDKGMRILTATQSDNVAWEYPTLKQGVLTYALLRDGIEARQADHNKDNTITLAEWLAYGVDRVPKLYQEVLTNSVQTFGLKSEAQPTLTLTARECGRAPGRKELEEVLVEQNNKSRTTQQPSLFDFTRKKREVVLSRYPPTSP